MMMRMVFSQNLETRLTLRQRLAQKLRLSLANRQAMRMTMRLELAEALGQDNYSPEGLCISCGYKLRLEEVLRGFSSNPHDTTTLCPICKSRFQPMLVRKTRSGSVEIPFYCHGQTLQKLRDDKKLEKLSPCGFKEKDQPLFASIRAHFGTIGAAYFQIGVDYKWPEIPKSEIWKEKVVDFLGRMPDTVIADCVGVKVAAIRKLRREKKISRYLASEHTDD